MHSKAWDTIKLSHKVHKLPICWNIKLWNNVRRNRFPSLRHYHTKPQGTQTAYLYKVFNEVTTTKLRANFHRKSHVSIYDLALTLNTRIRHMDMCLWKIFMIFSLNKLPKSVDLIRIYEIKWRVRVISSSISTRNAILVITPSLPLSTYYHL